VNWIVITAGGSGNGNGTVTYNVLANPNSGPRSATLTIAGLSFPVTQAGQGCQFGLTPASASPGVSGGSSSFNVTISGADCIWNANPNVEWLFITAGNSGAGNGTVSYTVSSNQASSFGRTGTISLTTSTTQATFTVSQAGGPCTYSLQQANSAFTAAGGAGTVQVSAPGGCNWTATNGPTAFVTITGGAPGSGAGTVSFTVPSNSSGITRTENLTVAGQQYTVTQAGAATASCTATGNPPPAIAIEGRTEILEELFVTCDGLSNATNATVTLTLNTSVTNALMGTGTTDAQLASGAAQLYGQTSGYSTLVWTNVPIGPGSTTLHITNVRVDASLLGNGATSQPAGVIAQVSVNTGTELPVSYSPQSAACSAAGSGEILGCAAPMLVFQKGQASPPAGGPQTIVPLVYQEAIATAFHAGGASPTRLRLVITKIPSTVRVFAPVYPTEGTSRAQLFSADSNGAGGDPVVGTSTIQGVYQELTVTQGTASATWLVLAADSSKIETWTFPLLVNNATNADLNTIQVAAAFAPVSDVAIASASAPVPRYRDFSKPQKLVNLRVTIVTSIMTASSAAAAAHLTAKSPSAGVSGNITSTIKILNDTSDPSQVATNVTIRGNASGATIVVCTASGAGQCNASGGTAQAAYSSLQPGESETVTWTEQSDKGAQTVGNTARAAADQVNLDLAAATASSFIILNNQPVVVSIDPPAGTASTQTFTAIFSHPNGWQNLGVVNILFNKALDAKRACYLAYSTQYGSLFLVDDAGSAGGPFAGTVPLGSSATAQNSQCIVGLVSAVADGNTLTLKLNITFKPAFGGNQVMYVAARDQSGNNSNWQALGVFQVPWTLPPLSVGSPNPARGAGATASPQNIIFSVTDLKGTADIGIVNVLINDAIDARRACYLAYVCSSNTLLLVNDAGDAGGPFAGTMNPGVTGTISNSQCQVTASTVSYSGTTGLMLSVSVKFTSGFSGNRVIYVAARDAAFSNNTGWQAVGTWTAQ
jgi:hypothetical protein